MVLKNIMKEGELNMLKLKSSKSSKLVFDLTIEGVDASEVDPKFRITYESVEYGFDAIIEKNQISILLPPLNLVMPELKNKDILEARLDVVANGEFFSQPWTDQIEINRPIQVKASVKESTVVEEEVVKGGEVK